MKAVLALVLLLTPICVWGQGTFLFDQESSNLEFAPSYGTGGNIQSFASPWGQSFTPTLSGVDFIRLLFDDGTPNDALGATLSINLHSSSISGPIIGTTAPVTMPNGFAGPTTFFFPSSVQLTPGVMYYFEPVLQSGGSWYLETEPHTYLGGNFFNNGNPLLGTDLWFREGLVVPEPASTPLLLLGVCGFLLAKQTHSS